MTEEKHLHDWETAKRWGVIIGLSRCLVCGKVAKSKDFPHIKTDYCEMGRERIEGDAPMFAHVESVGVGR